MAIPLLAVMALAGLAKGMTVDKAKEERQRKLAAETQRLSPWTGMQAGPIQEADPLGSAIAFGATGNQIATGQKNDALNEKLANKFLESGAPSGGQPYSPYMGMSAGGGGGYSVGGASGLYQIPQQENPYYSGMRNYGG